jgi:hypothetical protein
MHAVKCLLCSVCSAKGTGSFDWCWWLKVKGEEWIGTVLFIMLNGDFCHVLHVTLCGVVEFQCLVFLPFVIIDLIPFRQLFVTGYDQTGWDTWLADWCPPFSCCFADHPQLSRVLCFVKRSWLLSCFLEWDFFSNVLFFMLLRSMCVQ